MHDYLRIFATNREVRATSTGIDDHIVVVVDDFFQNADLVADLANSLQYGIEESRSQFRWYPGERAAISIDTGPVVSAVLRAVSSASGRPLSVNDYYRQPAIFTKMNDQLISKLDIRQVVPHVDLGFEFTGIVYLSSEQVGGGTNFYRHAPTGLSYVPHHPTPQITQMMKDQGFNPYEETSYKEYVKRIMYSGIETPMPGGATVNSTALAGSFGDWRLIEKVEIKYNRLVAFPATLFHSPMYQAKDHGEDGESRLTFNTFLARRR